MEKRGRMGRGKFYCSPGVENLSSCAIYRSCRFVFCVHQEMNKEFYCEICAKQYKNVGEMSNHLSSYDHHHVKVMVGIRNESSLMKREETITRSIFFVYSLDCLILTAYAWSRI